jgi:DNA-binding NtrC family response regulator
MAVQVQAGSRGIMDSRVATEGVSAAASLAPALLPASLCAQLSRVAASGVPVLLEGESGSGKDLAARYLHFRSGAAEPFLKLHASALAAGHGSWFGLGGGTLYLDQIGELAPAWQAELLRWLQEPEAGRQRPRLVAATPQELAEQVAAGQFRRDLLYRLNVVTLRLAPLRQRRAELPRLVALFLEQYNRAHGRAVPPPPAAVWRAWEGYAWPGNLRELENLVQRYVILESADALTTGLAARPAGWAPDGSLSLKQITRRAERQLERELIGQALAASRGNRKRAAGLLRISYRALLYKLKDADLAPPLAPAAARSEDQLQGGRV